jgi:vacuolar protein sorting-associated protein IST1
MRSIPPPLPFYFLISGVERGHTDRNLLWSRECDPGLEEPIKSLIYAAPRTEIRELQTVRQLLVEKYGKEFALSAIENSDKKVSERVIKKLRVEPPEEMLVTLYLKEIARTYGISYRQTPPGTPPPEFDDEEEGGGSGGIGERVPEAPLAVKDPKTAELAKATPPNQMRSPINIAPPSPSTENVHPVIRLPDAPKMPNLSLPKASVPKPQPTRNLSTDDELARRFAALKKP